MEKISNNIVQRVQGINSQIYWHPFFSNEDIERIIQTCTAKELQGSTVSQDKPSVNNQVHTSNVNFHYYDESNAWIFDRINFGIDDINAKFYNFDLHGYNYFQYSEYLGTEKGKYDFPMDLFTNEESLLVPLTRKLSAVILLSELGVDFECGEFQINLSCEEKLHTLEMRKGSLIVFPSFIIHRAAPVTKGIRRSLALWVEEPKFK